MTPYASGALGSGLVFFSRFPIIACSMHPYSLNGTPLDVKGGDWFVGKAAVSVVVKHPVLGDIQIFNTHVSNDERVLLGLVSQSLVALRKRWRRWPRIQ